MEREEGGRGEEEKEARCQGIEAVETNGFARCQDDTRGGEHLRSTSEGSRSVECTTRGREPL